MAGTGAPAAVAEAPTGESLTYKTSGVDIDAGNLFALMIEERVVEVWPHMKGKLGGFAGRVPIPQGATELSGSTDGPGTKILLNALLGDFTGIGQDAAAMAIVDGYVSGCLPAYFMDSIKTGKLDPELHIRIIEGLIEAGKLAGSVLIGGETAELPGFFRYDTTVDIDIAAIGFPIPNWSFVPVRPGQIIYGRRSGGVCANGTSMVRRVFKLNDGPSKSKARLLRSRKEFGGKSLAEVLLKPTPIYIQESEEQRLKGVKISAFAHITGGGFDNIPRSLPDDCKAVIDLSSWTRDKIFSVIQRLGNVTLEEMLKTFNNGIIFATIVDGEMNDPDAIKIGEVVAREGDEPQVAFTGKFNDED